MKYIAMSLFLIAGLAGCATTPPTAEEAKSAPSSRVLAFQEHTPETSGTIIVTRDVGFLGGGCFHSFWIDGTLAARLDTGEYAKFFVKPGEVVLKVGRDPQGLALCAAGQDQWVQRESIIRPNETKRFRVSLGQEGRVDIYRAD